MPALTPEYTKGTKTYYDEVLTRVAGVSKYNADQLRLDGLDGYWSMSEFVLNATKGQIPPEGTIAWFKLATNPKRGPNAKPGSMYQDIMNIRGATDEEKAAYSPPAGSAEAYAERRIDPKYIDAIRDASPQGSGPTTSIDQQIKLGMAFNNLTHMLAGIWGGDDDSIERRVDYIMEETGVTPLEQWCKWLHEASRGLPLTPVSDEPDSDIEDEAQQMDEQFRNTVDDRFLEPQAREDDSDVTNLPW